MPGPYVFKQIFAADPSNTANVATNASILLFAPGDPAMTPVVITDASTGRILANPVETNTNGFGPTFAHETLDQVAWEGGGFSGTFESWRGLKDDAEASAGSATLSAAAAAAAAEEAATAVQEALAGAVGDAAASRAAAEAAAALVGAPADVAIATAIKGAGTQTNAALSAAIGGRAAVGNRYSDAITSWWSKPASHYDDLRKRVYFSGCSRVGVQHVGYFDIREKVVHTYPLGVYEADDHNTPAMLIEDDRPAIVLIPRHGQAAEVRYRKGTAPHALDTLGPERVIPFAGGTSYGSILRQPGTDNIAVMTRDEGNAAGWTVARSADYGETWETPFRLFGSGYVTFRQVGNVVHGLAAGHPTTSYGGAAYFKIDLVTGNITNAHAPGTVLANFWTTTAVIPSNSLTATHITGAGVTPYDTSRTLDIGPTGSAAVMLFNRSQPELGGQYTVLRYKAGGVWNKEALTMSGVPLGYVASSYAGGMAFGATDNEVYLCRESSGTWTLERWTTPVAGQPWSLAEVLETRTDGNKLGRPIMPRNGEGYGHIVYGDYHLYNPDNYFDYYADQMMI